MLIENENATRLENEPRAHKILWFSKTPLTPKQINALKEKYGQNTKIDYQGDTFGDAKKTAARFFQEGYTEMVAVVPLSVLSILAEQGVPLVYSQAVAENDPSKIEFRGARGQGFRFSRFREVARVGLEFEEEVEPEKTTAPESIKRVLYLTRHEWTPSEWLALQEKFGIQSVIESDQRAFNDAKEIKKRLEQGNFDELVIVAPLSVIQELSREKINLYHSEMVVENDPNKVEYHGARGQGYRFERLRKIKGVALQFKDELEEKQ
jgi:hypothetical protein